MRWIGRVLQIVGLVLLPLSIVMELTGGLQRAFGVSDMLVMMVFGVCLFYVGRFIEATAAVR